MLRCALTFLLALSLPAQEMPKPTPHHDAMKAMAGTWDAVVKTFMEPGKPPMESKGVEVNAMALGGLWMTTEFKSDMAGMPFEGRGLFGYDPAAKKHVGTWVDNSGYWQAVSAGTCTDGCKTVTSTMKGYGMDGKPANFKEITRQTDADHRTMEMFIQGKDKKWVRMMEIAYTRRK